MKQPRFLPLLLLFFLFIYSCQRELEFPGDEDGSVTNRTYFTDTSAWELDHVFNLMKNMYAPDLHAFLQMYGSPDWDNSFQKRGSEIKITTIPMVINDTISGIIRMYVTSTDSTKVDFFTLANINASIQDSLNTTAYHAYRGAVQGMIICSHLMSINIDSKYENWLIANNDRIEERIVYHCLEIWECNGFYVSSATGYVYDNSINFNQNWGTADEDGCTLIYKECWVDWSTRVFPINWSGGSNTEANYGDGGSTNESTQETNAKNSFLTSWLAANNINTSYGSLVYDCVIYLKAPNGGTADVTINNACADYNLGLTGQDYEYDETYWSNPNLTFQSQSLPTYQDFYDAFPKNADGSWMYGADNIYALAGGAVLQLRTDYPISTNNTCALKVSIALNGAGIVIPNIPGGTIKGSGDEYYFVNAFTLTEWMKLTFGAPDDGISHMYIPFNDLDAPSNLFPPKKGIFSAMYGESANEASGHTDI